MKQPLYRWVCTMCGISDEAESSEMARINIDVHIQVAHPSTRKAVKVQPDPAWNLPALGASTRTPLVGSPTKRMIPARAPDRATGAGVRP
jgi:hypothetical protein